MIMVDTFFLLPDSDQSILDLSELQLLLWWHTFCLWLLCKTEDTSELDNGSSSYMVSGLTAAQTQESDLWHISTFSDIYSVILVMRCDQHTSIIAQYL